MIRKLFTLSVLFSLAWLILPQLALGLDEAADIEARSRAWVRVVSWTKVTVGALSLISLIALARQPSKGRRNADWIAPGCAALAWLVGIAAGATGWRSVLELGTTASWLVGAVAVAPCALACWHLRGRRGSGHPWRGFHRSLTLTLVGATGVLAWTQFGGFNNPRVVHYHDSYHYYVGTKYFSELGYSQLYAATIQAEKEDGFEEDVRARRVRDLQTNVVRPASQILDEQSPAARARFEPGRWREFSQDIRLFKSKLSEREWRLVLMDHGYNPTPVWTSFGKVMASAGGSSAPPRALELSRENIQSQPPAKQQQAIQRFRDDRERFGRRLGWLAVVDLLLYAASFALIGWAFGSRTLAFTLLLWGLGDPWSFEWTGGGIARVLWFFSAVAGVCCLRKGRPLLAGVALATTGLLRVFPLLLSLGVIIKAVAQLLRTRRLERRYLRLVLGAGGAVVVLGLSSALICGSGAWSGFFDNALLHRNTPLANQMGLGPLIGCASGDSYADLEERLPATEVLEAWKEGRRELLEERKLLGWALIAGLGGITLLAILRRRDWQATVLSVCFLFLLFDLTSYYYLFILLLAPLARDRLRTLVVLGSYAMLSRLIGLGMDEVDRRFELQSLLAFLLLATISFEQWRRPADGQEEEARAGAPTA